MGYCVKVQVLFGMKIPLQHIIKYCKSKYECQDTEKWDALDWQEEFRETKVFDQIVKDTDLDLVEFYKTTIDKSFIVLCVNSNSYQYEDWGTPQQDYMGLDCTVEQKYLDQQFKVLTELAVDHNLYNNKIHILIKSD